MVVQWIKVSARMTQCMAGHGFRIIFLAITALICTTVLTWASCQSHQIDIMNDSEIASQ